MKYKIVLLFFILSYKVNLEVLKRDTSKIEQSNNESFDDIVNKVYNHMNDINNKERKLEYQSLIPYYMPFGENKQYYLPLGNKLLPGGEKMDHFSYDTKQNRFAQLYNNYYRMLNKNLQFLQNIQKYQYDSNDTRFKMLDNPESFEYDHYFDGFNSNETMGQELPILYHKKNQQKQVQEEQEQEENEESQQDQFQPERKLTQINNDSDNLKYLQRRLKQINKEKKKVLQRQKYLKTIKTYYEKNYPEIVNKIGFLDS